MRRNAEGLREDSIQELFIAFTGICSRAAAFPGLRMMQDTVTDIIIDVIIDVILRSAPAERLHREAIVVPVLGIELLFEIREGQEGMEGGKPFVVFTVGTPRLAVVSRRKRLNAFMADARFLKGFLKQRGFVLFRGEAATEFGAIVCLDTLDRKREGFDGLSDGLCGREGGFVFESGQIAETGVFIHGGELVKPLAGELCIAGDAGDRDDLDIYLHTLAGIKHLFICAVLPFPPSEERGPGDREMPRGSLHTVFREK